MLTVLSIYLVQVYSKKQIFFIWNEKSRFNIDILALEIVGKGDLENKSVLFFVADRVRKLRYLDFSLGPRQANSSGRQSRQTLRPFFQKKNGPPKADRLICIFVNLCQAISEEISPLVFS